MLEATHWDPNLWAPPGPGSRSGLCKMFGNDVKGIESQAMLYIYRTQTEHFDRLGLRDRMPRLSPAHAPGLTLVDVENALCEIDKYARLKFPHLKGDGGRTVIKAKYTESVLPITYELPKKWQRGEW